MSVEVVPVSGARVGAETGVRVGRGHPVGHAGSAVTAVWEDVDTGKVFKGFVEWIDGGGDGIRVRGKDAVVGVVAAPVLHIVFEVEVSWDFCPWWCKLDAFPEVGEKGVPAPGVVEGTELAPDVVVFGVSALKDHAVDS